jgi:hypothetical protein
MGNAYHQIDSMDNGGLNPTLDGHGNLPQQQQHGRNMNMNLTYLLSFQGELQ